MPPLVAFPTGFAFIALSIVMFSIRGPLTGTNLFLVFQALPGTVAGFPLISVGTAFILGALLDVEAFLKRLPLPGGAATATLSYSLYLTHKAVFNLDKSIFGVENLQGLSGFVVYMSTSFAVATVLWFCVEQTSLRFRDQVLSPAP